jgi:hypothetical protein
MTEPRDLALLAAATPEKVAIKVIDPAEQKPVKVKATTVKVTAPNPNDYADTLSADDKPSTVIEQPDDGKERDEDGLVFEHPNLSETDCREHKFWVCVRRSEAFGGIIERDWDWFDRLDHLNNHRDELIRWITDGIPKREVKDGIWDVVAFQCKAPTYQPVLVPGWTRVLAGLSPGPAVAAHIKKVEQKFLTEVLMWSTSRYAAMAKPVEKKDATVTPSSRQVARKANGGKKVAPAKTAAPVKSVGKAAGLAAKARAQRGLATPDSDLEKTLKKSLVAAKAKAQRANAGTLQPVAPAPVKSTSLAEKARARRAGN